MMKYKVHLPLGFNFCFATFICQFPVKVGLDDEVQGALLPLGFNFCFATFICQFPVKVGLADEV